MLSDAHVIVVKLELDVALVSTGAALNGPGKDAFRIIHPADDRLFVIRRCYQVTLPDGSPIANIA